MRISVITPSRNRAATFLPDTAATVAALWLPEGATLEHVICDDASDVDGTREAYRALEDQYPHLKVVKHDAQRGVSAARNTALANATGDIILDVDDDDLLFQGAVIARANALQASGRAWVCGAGVTVHENGTYRIGEDLPYLDPAAFATRESALAGFLNGDIHAYASTRAYWRDTFTRAGGWDESYPIGEDYEHWLRLTVLVGPPAYLPAPTVAWRYKEHSLGIDMHRAGTMQQYVEKARIRWWAAL